MATPSSSIAFIGFGEAACAFLEGWALDDPARITAYDIKTDQADTRQSLLDRYRQHGVTGCATAAAAVAQAEVVFSLVTADCAHAAARTAAPSLRAGALWFDCNSCASDTKKAAAADIEAANARYVDVAVMAPVLPQRHRVPLLISGPHTEDALSVLQSLGMRPEATGDTVGQASSIKMLRSVMVKGIEALCAECLIAARRAGVEDQVIASLNASATQRDRYPGKLQHGAHDGARHSTRCRNARSGHHRRRARAACRHGNSHRRMARPHRPARPGRGRRSFDSAT